MTPNEFIIAEVLKRAEFYKLCPGFEINGIKFYEDTYGIQINGVDKLAAVMEQAVKEERIPEIYAYETVKRYIEVDGVKFYEQTYRRKEAANV